MAMSRGPAARCRPRLLLLAAASWFVLGVPALRVGRPADAHAACPAGGCAPQGREPCAAFAFAYRAEWSLLGLRRPGDDELPGRRDGWMRVRADVVVLHETSEYYLCESRLSGWVLGGDHYGGNVVREEVKRSAKGVERAREPVYFHWERNGEISHFMHNETQSADVLQLHRAILSALQVRLDMSPGGSQKRSKQPETDAHGVSWPRYHVAQSGANRVYTREMRPNWRHRSLQTKKQRQNHKSLHFKSRQRITSIVPIKEEMPTLPTSVDFTHNISTRLKNADQEHRDQQVIFM